ncbi:MAG: long-chain-fatty-acid--CoA ligase [Chloroflexi bacterium]|nr:long-chain-fatty-acid--CoA ligase [Chloroflexota bacterium]
MNTVDFLNISAAICPDREAIIFEDKRITFSQLNERTNRLANALKKLGVNKGDRIALIQVNTNANIEAYFACAKLGAVYVPLNFRAKAEEFTYMINTAEVNTLFVGDRYVSIVNPIRDKIPCVRNFIALEGKHPEMLDYEKLIASSPADDVITDIGDNDLTILMYTAGTTGFPKGVMLTQSNFVNYVLENVTPADPEMTEKNILTVPLYHVAGTQAVMAAIYGGRTLVIERQFEAAEWMGLVQREKANRAMMVPTMLKQLMEHPDFKKYDLSSLKVITYGAAPMPLEVIKKALDIFPGVSFINAFGQTETAATITTLGPEDHVIPSKPGPERDKKLKRLSSIGRPMASVEMKVIDEMGNELPPFEVGEIVARGPRVMAGYWKDEEKTRKTIDKDGWVHTTDMGYKDDEGYFFLAGRSDDMIKRGGELISPEEVEAALRTHPEIEEVAVIGVTDTEWGQQPLAVCVARGKGCSPDELMEYCRQKIASYKRPRAVIFVAELPRNPMGKVLKRELRKLYGKPDSLAGK